jgi:hypothetical protein
MLLCSFFLITGCKNGAEIPESTVERVWQDYHNNLFILGFESQVKREEKIQLLRQISRKYLIPNKKMGSFISKKYPKYAKVLFPESTPETKSPK